jgi:sugar lactone lactonase YvrE
MKRFILIALLICSLLIGTVSAAFVSPDFEGGMISGIYQDGSVLYATDIQNKVVWRVENGKASVFAGDRTYRDINGNVVADYFDSECDKARFKEPWDIIPFLDGWAVSDASANAVRYIVDGKVETACGNMDAGFLDGFCTEARLSHPTGLAVDNDGYLYISDTGNGAIRRLDTEGNLSTIRTGLSEPMGICWYKGSLYIAETGRSRILRMTNGSVEVLAGDGGSMDEYGVYGCGYADGPAASALFEHPQDVTVAEDGTIYIADTGNGAVRRLMDGRVSTMAVTTEDNLQLASPQGILVKGNQLLVSDSLTGAIMEFDTRIHEFKDVAQKDWFAPSIREALIRGIIAGDSDTFRPNDPMTRADFVTMLANLQRSLDGSTVLNGSFYFTDINDSTPYGAVARWSGDFGIITGTETGAFEGDTPIQRQQMVTILYRFITISEMDNAPAGDLNGFSDGASTASYARNAMLWAVSRGIINGFPDGTLAPSGGATRAQAVKMIVYFMDMYGF